LVRAVACASVPRILRHRLIYVVGQTVIESLIKALAHS
jgi:hypothetical protein